MPFLLKYNTFSLSYTHVYMYMHYMHCVHMHVYVCYNRKSIFNSSIVKKNIYRPLILLLLSTMIS